MADDIKFICPHMNDHRAIDSSNVSEVSWENIAALQDDETAYFVDEAAADDFEKKIKDAQGRV